MIKFTGFYDYVSIVEVYIDRNKIDEIKKDSSGTIFDEKALKERLQQEYQNEQYPEGKFEFKVIHTDKTPTKQQEDGKEENTDGGTH